MLQPYKSLKGYLERWTVLKIGKLHIRLHDIKRNDATPFLHNHPFHYLSFILNGGYVENLDGVLKTRKKFSIAFRSDNTYHRIVSVKPNTRTLFFTWKTNTKWNLKPTEEKVDEWVDYPSGMYIRTLWGKPKYCKFDKFWFEGKDSKNEALNSIRPSIDQTSKPD
jgi:hypothetical protein